MKVVSIISLKIALKHRNDKVECALTNIYYQGLILDRHGMPDYCKAFFTIN